MSRSLNMNLIYCFFDAANMHRWNDHLRPMELTELDKQAHKVAIAWILAKYDDGVEWRRLIENSMFSFIQRLILTDLKPQLFHRIEEERSNEVNEFVLNEFKVRVPDCNEGLLQRFSEYLNGRKDTKEDQIVRAAHYLATNWEFRLIKDMNKSMYFLSQTERDIEAEIKAHYDLKGFKEIYGQRSFSFIDLVGQLRFQQRWARTPRIPKTTVLGHMLLVANMVYLNDLDKGTSDDRMKINYFKALFHDLPEVLTKDVISPVKNSIHGLNKLLEEYERDMVESQILPLLPDDWHDEFREMIYEPFAGDDGYDIKTCDMFAAYMEAEMSLRYGVGSENLVLSKDDLKASLLERKGIDALQLIEDLERMVV